MDIVLIGSGNTATVLGRRLVAGGHQILQVFSPQQQHAERLALRLKTSPISSKDFINKKAEGIIISLRDEALADFVHNLSFPDSLVMHTAGALSIGEIRNLSTSYGVLYPLQSLRKEIETIPPLNLLVDGNNDDTLQRIKNLALTISENVIVAHDDVRLKYHLAATLVNNFTNHLFVLTESFCEKENISFVVLQPLLEETVMRLKNISPFIAQTGPAMRRDQQTLEKHRLILNQYPDLARVYELFTEEIQKFYST